MSCCQQNKQSKTKVHKEEEKVPIKTKIIVAIILSLLVLGTFALMIR